MASTEVGRSKVQEVIVTAQKRRERIQDVPFAITAIDQKEIQDRGSIDIKDLQYSIPGLNMQELSPGANRTIMRGISPGQGLARPVVGFYVDDVGISPDFQQRDGVFPLVDIDRIEVLRGPQGTLYGQGSTAGTIRYITRNPDLAKADGYVEANAYNQESGDIGYRLNGGVGIPLVTDRAGLRLSGGYDRIAGWIDYPAAGVKDANETTRLFIRPKLYAQLTDQLTFTLLYQYYNQEADTEGSSGIASPDVRPGRTRLYPNTDRSHLVNAILSYDLGSSTLLSSTGYQQRNVHIQSPIAIFLADLPEQYEQFSQELRISSNGKTPFRYTAGLWYRKSLFDINRILFDANGIATTVARGLGHDDTESMAAFGDGTYAANDRLDLSLGARYYRDHRNSGSVIPPSPDLTADFHDFSPRASMKYAWTHDASTYITVSKGFRSGGLNSATSSYGPEALWNYEVGTKASLLEGTLFIDLTGYYLDYKDRQAVVNIQTAPGVFLPEIRSTGKASGFGLEGSISARLGAGVRLDATAAYNDIESDVTNAEVVKGERFSFVPEVTGSISLSQETPINEKLNGMWRIDYQYAASYLSISRQAAANGTVTTTQNYRNDPQNILNARIGVETGRVGLYLDAHNVLNEDTILFPFSPITTTQEGTRFRPRSYGLTLRVDF